MKNRYDQIIKNIFVEIHKHVCELHTARHVLELNLQSVDVITTLLWFSILPVKQISRVYHCNKILILINTINTVFYILIPSFIVSN